MAKTKRKKGRPLKVPANTPFAKFLDKHLITASLASDKLDVSESYIYGLRRGVNLPGREMAIKIRDWAATYGSDIPVDVWERAE